MAWMSYAALGITQGVQAQQQQNLNLANRTFSAQQAALQRQWEGNQQLQAEQYNTQMSDTAVQRRVQDLKAAGLNPYLGITNAGGGASSPQMSAPGGASAATPQTGLPSAGLTNAIQSASTMALQEAQTRDTAAHAAQTEATNPYAAKQAQANIGALQAQADQLTRSAMELSVRYNVEKSTDQQLQQNMDYQRRLSDLDIAAKGLEISGKAYGLTRERLLSEFYNTPAGQQVLRMQAGKQAGLPGEIVTGTSALGAAAERIGNTIKGAAPDQMPQDVADTTGW